MHINMQDPVSESWDTFFPHPQQENAPAGDGAEVPLRRACGRDWAELTSLHDFLIPEVERAGSLKGLGWWEGCS